MYVPSMNCSCVCAKSLVWFDVKRRDKTNNSGLPYAHISHIIKALTYGVLGFERMRRTETCNFEPASTHTYHHACEKVLRVLRDKYCRMTAVNSFMHACVNTTTHSSYIRTYEGEESSEEARNNGKIKCVARAGGTH